MKTKNKVILAVVIILVIGIAIAAFCIMRHNAKYISEKEAINIAMSDAAVSNAVIIDAEAEFDKGSVTSIYEVELDTSAGEYEYKIDAETGEILLAELKVGD